MMKDRSPATPCPPIPSRRQIMAGIAAAALLPGMARADDPVTASKAESGLLIYSIMAEYNWRPLLRGFQALYPWIKVNCLDMGPSEVFERYYAETSVNRASADIIVSSAADAWMRFAAKGSIGAHVSREDGSLPAWSRPMPGLYTLSADPMVMIYNKLLLKPDQYPDGLNRLAALAEENPLKFRKRVTTYDAAAHALAYAVHWAAITSGRPGGWDLMQRLSPAVRVESGGAAMMEKVTTGEYLVGFNVSAVTVWPQMATKGRSEIVDWTLDKDGTVLVPRGMAVTAGSRSPASARLMLDYLLSHDGQVAAAQGGLMPYRSDVRPDEVPYLTYDGLVRRLGGEDRIVHVSYDPTMLDHYQDFIARWNATFKARR
ncbi:ABC transporter substrate-binding protein [Niveispirillum cyanobacteriorum]|uniref:ABC transporter substrate-binding protein n=1 Tax=Niveispirillum cyanobacteriorum TaxID=1612173 RepID=A0A2K9NIY4_9PROT|nr:ABC transporter substrate-binding protein [Niveispirillum cyanobacteriorum]AUN32265.1 ABC transporter substrate-binding protein [Niveispirillum cyanobacteriorum]